MNWDALDFIAAAILLGTVGLSVTLVFRRSGSGYYRAATVIAVLAGFLLLWSNGAVGIIGGGQNDANMLFLGVPGIAVLGALLVRFRSRGLSWVMIATAAAQLAVPAVVDIASIGDTTRVWSQDVVVISVFFVAMWLTSALLFSKVRDRHGRLGSLKFK